MGLTEELALCPSGRSIQTHFPTDYTQQYIFPFAQGERVRVQIVPHTAVVLLPLDEDGVEYPLTVRDPAEHRPELTDGGHSE